uniref:NADH dehydrogenase subunit 6 n=1 Tax=Apatetica glabra TaxID=3044283 RepID=UPI002551EB4C|nr:NADH dehydrogenase subunit 6 [Apatetica glabra]WGU20048.1 NADH dehydrogenase subunit 6 [Apatetica glabra]
MLLLLLSLLLTLSILFLFLNHPMSMGITLLMQTIMIALITGFINYNYWFSYILFLIMVGGMLVLFIYMTSIASNEKFKFSNKIFMLIPLSMISYLSVYFIIDQMMLNISNKNEIFFIQSLSKFINFPSNILLFLMIIYLFITLIAVVKITDMKIGPLRQK